jgi:ParB-like chromosome segregation protein Spo0J
MARQRPELDAAIARGAVRAAADTLSDGIRMLDVGSLAESPDNFFEPSRIEELAEAILAQGGVKENLVVRPAGGGGYEIVSGHRRAAAVRRLLERGAKVSRYLPCLVQDYGGDDDARALDIVLMNVSARVITDAELWKSYEVLNAALARKKGLGVKVGQLQRRLAETLGVSTGQAAKLQGIDRHAVDEVKEALEGGEISINTAGKISRLDPGEQRRLAAGRPLSEVRAGDVPPPSPAAEGAPAVMKAAAITANANILIPAPLALIRSPRSVPSALAASPRSSTPACLFSR